MLTSIMTNRHIINANKILYKTFGKLGIKIPQLEYKVMPKFVDHTGQDTSDQIKTAILENKPLMVARFGRTELRMIHMYCSLKLGFSKYIKYALGSTDSYKITKTTLF